VDGLEGDDVFDVLSTAPGIATRVIGGLGSDTINVAGDVAGDVVSRDIEGTSGTINHGVSSNDPLYNGIVAGGVDVNVARATQGQVVIEESGGFTDVSESVSDSTGTTDTYQVYLAQQPTQNVYVTVSAAMSPREEQVNGDTFLVSPTPPNPLDFFRHIVVNGQTVAAPQRAIVLVFTPAAWDKVHAQTISVGAVNDTRAEGDRVIVASHSVISDDPVFDHAIVRNVEVTVHDNDLPAIQPVQRDPVTLNADNNTIVVQGTSAPAVPATELIDIYDVKLSVLPSGTVAIDIRPSDDRVYLSGGVGFSTVTARAPGVPGVYRVLLTATATGSSAKWDDGVRITVHAANDFVRQDPHNTTIIQSINTVATTASAYAAVAATSDKRVDALVIDDDTPGVVVVESDGRTLVNAGTTLGGPGLGDNYRLRLTLAPSSPVTIALVTDGQTDITTGGRISLQPIGGLTAFQQFLGDLTIAGTTITRAGESALGNFTDEGFASGQLIRLTSAGAANGDYTIASVSSDGSSLTLTTAPTGGNYSGAILSRLVNKGVYTGTVGHSISYNSATGELTRDDGTSWLDSGFLEGQLIKVGADGNTYKIESFSSIGGGTLNVLKLTDKSKPASGSVASTTTVTQWAAVVTFTGGTGGNWYDPVTVPILADPWFDLAPGRESIKSFSKRAHLLSDLRGPLAVEGGTTSADRSLRVAVLLPGEGNGPLFAIAAQPPEAQQVDTLNIFADSSKEDLTGTLTATALTGLNMSTGLNFTAQVGISAPFGEPAVFPGGISYGSISLDAQGNFQTNGSTSTIEVLNILLGEGNDNLTISSTLVPGQDHNADGTLGSVAVHGGITSVHGGGNSLIAVRGNFSATASTITRTDGVSWASAGFETGKQVTFDGALVGTISALSGSTLTVTGGSFTAGSYTDRTVAVRDPKTLSTRIGGDTITITGGAGPNSPLVVYGDTSQDGIWYSGDPRQLSIRDFGTKPFPTQLGNGTPKFFFPIASPYRFAGNDVINASALFAGTAVGSLPSVGFIAYGGVGDDLLIGSQAGDFLVGGSGDDEIRGQRGSDQIYGDNGVNVNVITRELSLPSVNASVRALRDSLTAGKDLLYGEQDGGSANTANEYDDVIFGDYGIVTQDILSAVVGLASHVNDPNFQGGYERSAAKPQRIQTVGRIRDIATVRPQDGADDVIHGNGGRDRIFGGNGADTITGDGESNVLFGDHGHMLYVSGTSDITPLHMVESINFPQGGIDNITANGGDDFIFGGAKGDTISGGNGSNVAFGDHGRITGMENAAYNRPIGSGAPANDDYQIKTLVLVESIVPAGEHGGNDQITTGIGRDMIFGGAGFDTIIANNGENLVTPILDGNNIVFGDYGFVDYLSEELLHSSAPGLSLLAYIAGASATGAPLNPIRPNDIDRVWSIDAATALGGNDDITTGAGNDIILGGTGVDRIVAGQGKNIALSDNGKITADGTDLATPPFSVHELTIGRIETIGFADADSGNDTIVGGDQNDVIFGGGGDDIIYAGAGNDLVFGDQGIIQVANNHPFDPDTSLPPISLGLGGFLEFRAINFNTTTGAGNDLVYGQDGMDVILGQQGADVLYGGNGDDILIGGSNVAGALDGDDGIDGGAGHDAIAGDNANIYYRPDILDPRMRVLEGAALYGTSPSPVPGYPNGNDALALVNSLNAQNDPIYNDPRGNLPGNAQPIHREYLILLLDHDDTIAQQPNVPSVRLWGNDYIAGGAGEDEIFGELGDDVIQGDGKIGTDSRTDLSLITNADSDKTSGPTAYGASRTVMITSKATVAMM
jgi:Ca2+-binding RTX toxin-like protein